MKRFSMFSLACFIGFCLLIATDRSASAYYVDPGSGLLALQSAASVMAAFGYFMRRRIRALFSSREEAAVQIPSAPEKGARREV
jgi:hypothetical protein